MKKLLLLFSIFVLIPSLLAQTKTYTPTKFSASLKNDKTIPLRDIEPVPPIERDRSWKQNGIPNQLGRPSRNYRGYIDPEYVRDPAIQSKMGGVKAKNMSSNFEGVGNLNGVYPPDPSGDVGPNHYFQMVNISFAIYDKNGTTLYGPADNITLWDGFTGPWSTTNDGDPIVLYDPLADRWVVSQFALPNFPNGPFYELIAVSETGDPLGSWYRYAFQFDQMPDYPKLGVWADGYYLSINQFSAGSLSWRGAAVAVLERDKMLTGNSASMIFFDLGTSADPESMLPSDIDGIAPPPGTPNYFSYVADGAIWGGQDRLEIYEFTTDWTTQSNSTFIGPLQLPTDPFDMNVCFSRDCIPQPSTSQGLDAISDRLMYRLPFRVFDGYNAMVANHTVDVDGNGKAGIRWYELRDYGSGWTIYQQGTYSPDNENRWMGSIAIDSTGNIALGYTVSSSSTYPSIRYTGRNPGAPLGQMIFNEEEIVAGTGSQTGSASRWGDYSQMTVDPADESTFWMTHEYVQTTGTTSWKTRVASFTFEVDVIPPDAVIDLNIVSSTSNSITLQWTASGDDGIIGNAYAYELKHSTTGPIDDSNWDSATPIAHNLLPQASGSTENLEVEGLEIGTTYYFAVKVLDNLANSSGISNSPSGTTYLAPEVSVQPTSISKIIEPNTIVNDVINVSNITSYPSTLSYSIELANNTFPSENLSVSVKPVKSYTDDEMGKIKDDDKASSGQAIEGFGGPDTFGYEWIDSDEPNGPAYVWEDIASTGTLTSNWVQSSSFAAKDEGYAGPFSLGFDFDFYGIPHSQLYVNSNGYLSFEPVTVSSFTNDQIPDNGSPNNIIAAVWDDLDGSSSGDVYYQQDGNRFIVQYDQWGEYSGSGKFTFQFILYSSGKILVYYKTLTGDLNSSTVGIENADGTDGLQVVYNAAYLKNELAIKYAAEPEWLTTAYPMGLLYNGNSFSLDLVFDTNDLLLGEYSMDVILSSNDPVNPEITIPVTMTVSDEVPVELVSFTVERNNSSVILSWTTATESNNDGFEIQRRVKNSPDWDVLGYASGKGTTTEVTKYNFNDNLSGVAGKIIEYRLKQNDLDGTFTFSNTIEISVAPNDFELMQNYPNPFNPATTIKYALPVKSNVKVNIYSVLGEVVTTLVNEVQESGYYESTWDAAGFSSGMYILHLQAEHENGTFTSTKQMMFVK